MVQYGNIWRQISKRVLLFRSIPSSEFQLPATDLEAPVGFTENPTKNSGGGQKDSKAMDIERLTVKVSSMKLT